MGVHPKCHSCIANLHSYFQNIQFFLWQKMVKLLNLATALTVVVVILILHEVVEGRFEVKRPQPVFGEPVVIAEEPYVAHFTNEGEEFILD